MVSVTDILVGHRASSKGVSDPPYIGVSPVKWSAVVIGFTAKSRHDEDGIPQASSLEDEYQVGNRYFQTRALLKDTSELQDSSTFQPVPYDVCNLEIDRGHIGHHGISEEDCQAQGYRSVRMQIATANIVDRLALVL